MSVGSFDVASFIANLIGGTPTPTINPTANVVTNSNASSRDTWSTVLTGSSLASVTDVFVGTSANEWFDGGNGNNLYISNDYNSTGAHAGNYGTNTYIVGPGKTAGTSGGSGTLATTTGDAGSNDVIVLGSLSEHTDPDAIPTEIIYMKGVRDNESGQPDRIAQHGPVLDENGDPKDYRIDYVSENGTAYSTYIVNMYGTDGNPDATIWYDNCTPLTLNTTPIPTPTPTPTVTVTVTVTVTPTPTPTVTVPPTCYYPPVTYNNLVNTVTNSSFSASNAQILNHSTVNGFGFPWYYSTNGNTSSGTCAPTTCAPTTCPPTCIPTTCPPTTVAPTTCPPTTCAPTVCLPYCPPGSTINNLVNTVTNRSASLSNAQIIKHSKIKSSGLSNSWMSNFFS